MKIGVWLNKDYNPEEGGGFSYYDRLVHAIDTYQFADGLDICFVTEGAAHYTFNRQVVVLKSTAKATLCERIKKHLPLVGWHYQTELTKRLAQAKWKDYRSVLETNGVKLLFYPTSGRAVPNFPFVATNWDIGHLSTFAFPEVSMDGQFESRQHYYSTILPQALLTFCESEAGKQELLQFTNIKEDKLQVVPIFAGKCVDVKVGDVQQQEILNRYNLVKYRYFFYPAQFWAHKNHYTLLNAFKLFIAKYPDYKLVLTGSDQGNLAYVKQLISDYGLTEKVVFPGFVPIETINTFYLNATSLLMATYFGPTNMPPLEAMALGCPVVCSDLAGHREQLGDAALYFNAGDDIALLNCMLEVSENNKVYRKKIVEQQRESIFTIDHALKRIDKYLLNAVEIRSTWD